MKNDTFWPYSRRLCSALLFFFCSSAGLAQNTDSTATRFKARNSVYLEVAGTAVVYSLNYDRILSDRKKWKFGGRVGFALLNFSLYDSRVVGEFYTLKALKNRQDRYLEFGLGALYRAPRLIYEIPRTTDTPTIALIPRVGLRWQPLASGTIVRVGATPTFIIDIEKSYAVRVTPWAGFAIGRSF